MRLLVIALMALSGNIFSTTTERSPASGGSARFDEGNIEVSNTIQSSPKRDSGSKIDYDSHNPTGQNTGQLYKNVDDQQKMEDAREYLLRQKAREGKPQGAASPGPEKVWPQVK